MPVSQPGFAKCSAVCALVPLLPPVPAKSNHLKGFTPRAHALKDCADLTTPSISHPPVHPTIHQLNHPPINHQPSTNQPPTNHRPSVTSHQPSRTYPTTTCFTKTDQRPPSTPSTQHRRTTTAGPHPNNHYIYNLPNLTSTGKHPASFNVLLFSGMVCTSHI